MYITDPDSAHVVRSRPALRFGYVKSVVRLDDHRGALREEQGAFLRIGAAQKYPDPSWDAGCDRMPCPLAKQQSVVLGRVEYDSCLQKPSRKHPLIR